ncbi:hypothetical protein ACFQU2_09835 [Siccirubricoccus deserti]
MSMVRGFTAARPRGASLVLRYAAFAVFASGVNLLVQVAAMALYQGPYALLLAMAAGTVAGLVPNSCSTSTGSSTIAFPAAPVDCGSSSSMACCRWRRR